MDSIKYNDEFPHLNNVSEYTRDSSKQIQDFKQDILHFYFGLAREDPYESVEKPLTSLLIALKMNILRDGYLHSETCLQFLRILYLMIGHTRDIYVGRGERDLSFHMIYVWYQYFPVLAIYALHQFFGNGNEEDRYGSMKDLVYFPHYIRSFSKRGVCLLDICVKSVNRIFKKNPASIIEWIPSERSSKGWLFELLAKDFYGLDFYDNISIRYMNKLSMNYRKRIGEEKDKHLSLSLGKHGSHMCKNTDLGKYVKHIVESHNDSLLIYTPESGFNGKKEILFINQKWRNIVAEYDFIQIVPCIPMIDISLEMSDYELYSAIGIACLIAHKSGIQRVLLMSHIPIWVIIDNSMDFISMVLKIWNECKKRTICNYQSAVFMVHHSQIVCNFQVSIILLSNFHFLKRKYREKYNKTIKTIFWNVGTSWTEILPLCDSDILLIAGKSLSAIQHLDLLYVDFYAIQSYDFLCRIMEDSHFRKLGEYFDYFCYKSFE
jgi:hypothetical protein